MPTDPISRYLDDFGGDLKLAEARAVQIAHALQGMEHEMEYISRVNEIRSPEVRQASRANEKEEWERLQRMREWRKGTG